MQNFIEPSLGIDDQGNGVAAWTRDEFRSATDFYRFQAASFDAAAPSLNSSVPPGAKVGVALADGRRGERPRLAGVAELELRRRRDRDRAARSRTRTARPARTP